MVNETNTENTETVEETVAVLPTQSANDEATASEIAVSDDEPKSAAAADAAEPVEADAAASSEAMTEGLSEAAAPEMTQLVVPLSEMTPEERFRATTRLIFLAPDVPPIPPRPRRTTMRRTELQQLDDLLDQRRPIEDEPERRESQSSSRRRRAEREAPVEDEPRRRERPAAPVITEPQKVKGSTRLEAKKQRRRDGRDAGRRRMVITESEFLARRESVDREMIVRTTADRVQIGVLEDKVLVEHYVARSSESSLIGNVYLGRVQNVLPSMEAAFVDIGRGRNAVLYSGEVDWSEFEGGNTARRIENALKPGDQVLVQVTKDPVGHKGARLTSQISLPGRFLVYVPGGAMNGISRKLPDTERARLKKILKEVLPSGAGVIVRTAAEGATEEQLTHDVQRLTRQWESIKQRADKGGGPVQLHSEPDMLIKIVRDVFNEDFHRMSISGSDTFTTIQNYLEQVAPDLLQRVERYDEERDIFDAHRINEQIAKALDRKVWLPSGGSLVIDRTEAMTVVDVNTGKFVGSGGNLEETVTKNNLEAAEEIVRQLRLRDIGGIIVIDFIDMVLESNRDLVLRRLVECLSRDRTKHQVAEVTSLGLVQMTRKKLGLGLLESFSEPCDVCAGRGLVVHHEPVTKHHRPEPSRGSKRSRGSNNQQHQSQNQHQAHHESKSQTHAITDGAKNMLAQVAASTLPVAKEADVSAEQSVAVESTPAAERKPRATGRAKVGVQREAPVEPASAPAVDLLDSVLNALPEAPAAGAGRAKGRRVSTSTMRTGASESQPDSVQPPQTAAPSEAGQAKAAVKASVEDAQLALAQALDAAAAKRQASRGE